jgi:G3E family GTPase
VTFGPAIPLHIVTGFLGAGKTTLVNRLLKAPEFAGTLVIVNEFGEIGLDHMLFETVADDVILLAAGCLCCALRGDLVDALHALLRRRDAGEIAFARIVLETSGLADPAPILYALIADAGLARRIELAGVTTMVDAVNGAVTLARHGEARRQVALAGQLALAKSDLAAPPALASLRETLGAINPAARILDVAAGEFSARDAFEGALDVSMPDRASRMSAHGDGARARVFTSAAPIGSAALARFLARLGDLLGPRLLRVKGLVATAELPDRPLLIQGAQHLMHPPRRLAAWPTGPRETRLVVISEGLKDEAIASLWRALTGVPDIDRPDWAAVEDNPLAPRRGGLF